MAKELKVSGNYVIATDLILPNQILGQFPINHCVYRENDNSFIILEQIDNEVVTIDKAQVDAGEWVDEGSTPFTQATLLTFLRDNTGFNTAGGGSPALPYLIYSALLTQTGTNPPVATILQNTLGNIVWSRIQAGDYRATLLGAFTLNKTVMFLGKNFTLNTVAVVPHDVVVDTYGSTDEVSLNSIATLGGLADDKINNLYIEIRVYP